MEGTASKTNQPCQTPGPSGAERPAAELLTSLLLSQASEGPKAPTANHTRQPQNTGLPREACPQLSPKEPVPTGGPG